MPETDTAFVPASALSQVPLLGQLLEDPNAQLVARPVDANWAYHANESKPPAGWNPFRGEVYFAANSAFAEWMNCNQETCDLRILNENDKLLEEAMFAVHDYLHAWACAAIRQLRPSLEFGTGPITDQNFEDHVFAMLVGEAVATVGLDYWYLCCERIDDLLDIGTRFSSLTNKYAERNVGEFLRFNPDFEVQSPDFFGVIARFYCTGRFPGFSREDVQRSPLLMGWLEHELSYGVSQRRYSRAWMRHLQQAPTSLVERTTDGAAVECDQPWQRRLVAELGEMLWAKVKRGDRSLVTDCLPERTWTAPRDRVDFRFTNVNALPASERTARAGQSPMSSRLWLSQMRGRRRCPREDKDALAAIKAVEGSPAAARWALSQLPLMEGVDEDDVRDLFFLA